MRNFALAWMCIPRLAFLLWVAAAPGVVAQTLITGTANIPPQQCRWREATTPPWADPNLRPTEWNPYTTWTLNPHQPYVWLRCSLHISALNSLDHPAIQVRLPAAYELRLNTELIARNGSMSSGGFTLDTVHTWAIPPAAISAPQTGSGVADLDLRIVYSSKSQWQWGSGLVIDPGAVGLEVGAQNRLADARAGQIANSLPEALLGEGPMTLMGIVGFVLLIVWAPDGGQPAPILFAIFCILVSIVFGQGLLATIEAPIPMLFMVLLSALARTGNAVAISMVPFVLAGRRIPLPFRVLIGIAACAGLEPIFALPLSPAAGLALNSQFSSTAALAFFASFAILSFSPFLAFWPYRKIPRGLGWIAVVLMIDGTAQFLWFIRVLFGNALAPALAPLLAASLGSSVVFESSVASNFAALAALIGLMLRRQRRVASQRAELAGEMQAAHQMQRVLVGESIERLPAVRIEAAFYPAREVGGDFYSCRLLSPDRQRILIGDVSGKGAAAAMTAAVLLGATLRRDSDSPAALLNHLNRCLAQLDLGGFATCLVAELSSDGLLTISNAGHLAPYRNGHEIPLESALPLGIDSSATHSQTTLHLAPNDQLTFLSDGVLEATNPATGELFGFDRTAAISTQSAEEIASAAQQFGQEDDITVLTLAFAPAEVLHA